MVGLWPQKALCRPFNGTNWGHKCLHAAGCKFAGRIGRYVTDQSSDTLPEAALLSTAMTTVRDCGFVIVQRYCLFVVLLSTQKTLKKHSTSHSHSSLGRCLDRCLDLNVCTADELLKHL